MNINLGETGNIILVVIIALVAITMIRKMFRIAFLLAIGLALYYLLK